MRIFYAALLPGLLGIVFSAGSRKRRLQGIRLLGLLVILGGSTLWLASCGGSSASSSNNGGGSTQGTPAGTYTISVSGTSGSATATTSFQVVVQ